MKTIAFNRSNSTMLTTFFVVGSLIGLYLYRRQGGRPIGALLAGVGNIGQWFAKDESVATAIDATKGVRRSRRNVSSSMDMNHVPSN